jgi:hypothetical protein
VTGSPRVPGRSSRASICSSRIPRRPAGDAASHAVHHVERDYREAMAELLQVDDLRTVLAGQDLYRRYLVVAEAVVEVADRLWYVVLRGA